MNPIFIPNVCPKCENDTELERYEDRSAAAYCRHCDFILKLTKEEMDSLEA